jgi:hypothetical protein
MMNNTIENAAKAKACAEEKASGGNWIEIYPGIYLAARRMPKSGEQKKILAKEIDHARILAERGHTVYLLPEHGPRGVKHPDAVVDGFVMEFKTVTGNVRKIAGNFKAARKKAVNVFIKIDSGFSQETVLEKLIGTVRRGAYKGGLVIAHFTATGKTYYWNIDDLK